MDPDVNIYQRQMQEEVKEKYQLYKRIDELVKQTAHQQIQIDELKEKIKKFEEKLK